MKDLVKKAESFITFSMPLQAEFISIQFTSIHNQYQREFSKWGTASTRQKLIATYWLSDVLEHFLLLFVLSGLTIFVTNRPAISYFLPGALLASVLVMPVLFLFHYWPSYAFDFLPKLEMAKESFENVQHDKIEPMLFLYEPEQYWQSIRQIIREEVINAEKQKQVSISFETPGLTYKPLYKIAEVCAIFHVTKPTIYDWVEHGKLKPFKIRSRVYFLWQDIQQLIQPQQTT